MKGRIVEATESPSGSKGNKDRHLLLDLPHISTGLGDLWDGVHPESTARAILDTQFYSAHSAHCVPALAFAFNWYCQGLTDSLPAVAVVQPCDHFPHQSCLHWNQLFSIHPSTAPIPPDASLASLSHSLGCRVSVIYRHLHHHRSCYGNVRWLHTPNHRQRKEGRHKYPIGPIGPTGFHSKKKRTLPKKPWTLSHSLHGMDLARRTTDSASVQCSTRSLPRRSTRSSTPQSVADR